MKKELILCLDTIMDSVPSQFLCMDDNMGASCKHYLPAEWTRSVCDQLYFACTGAKASAAKL